MWLRGFNWAAVCMLDAVGRIALRRAWQTGLDPDDGDPSAPRETTSFSQRIDKNATVTHTVSVEETGEIDLHLDWDESRVDLSLRARDPSGEVVFFDDSSARPKSGSLPATTTGDYRFDVINNTDRRTDYILDVTHPAPSNEPPPSEDPELSSLELDPITVTGGSDSQATVTLTTEAPSGGATVSLASSNTGVATVPNSVTVPGGATSATFTVSTHEQDSDQSATISASYGGVTESATLSVTTPESSTDSVSISRARYDTDKQELRVEASSSDSSATLRVHVTATDELIGTLDDDGKGEFSWPSNPERITVRSSSGGSDSRSVTVK